MFAGNHVSLRCAAMLTPLLWLFWPLVGSSSSVPSLQPEEIALIQFDSRPLDGPSYWRAAHDYNAAYCRIHQHVYVFYTLLPQDTCNIHGEELASPW